MSVGPLLGIGLARAAESVAGGILSFAKSLGSKRASASQQVDSASISPAAKRLNRSTMAQLASAAGADSPANLAAYGSKLGKLFSENGIDTSQEIDLRANASGRIEVANDHPDKARIEALLERHPELAAQFQQLSAAASAAQQNAKSAAAQYAQASSSTTQFHLALQNGAARTYFASV